MHDITGGGLIQMKYSWAKMYYLFMCLVTGKMEAKQTQYLSGFFSCEVKISFDMWSVKQAGSSFFLFLFFGGIWEWRWGGQCDGEIERGWRQNKRKGRAEARSDCYWGAVWLLVWELFRGARRWDVGGRVQVCWCIGQALLLPNPGPLPSVPPEPADTPSLRQRRTAPLSRLFARG